MALITCPECGRQISEYAESCPECGCPAKVWKEAGSAPGTAATLGVGEHFQLGAWAGEPLEWRVLSIDDDGAYALCEVGVTCEPFRENEWSGNVWQGSHLAKWLAQTFATQAFSADERARIREVTCLSDEEAERFFASNNERACLPTAVALKQRAYTSEVSGACCWWLRTPCDEDTDAMYVDMYGRIHPYGCIVSDTGIAVRPALRLAQ